MFQSRDTPPSSDRMTTNEDALAVQLASLVAPNWPTIKGTDISVMDVKDCASRGTVEQRQTARQARDLMEIIWAMGEDAPVRRLLEALCRHEENTTGHGLVGPEGVMPPPTLSWQSRQLPNELVLRVFHFLIPDDDGWPRDIEVATLGCMRAVSRSIKDLAETRFPNTLHRYIARIARKVLHGDHSEVQSSRLAHASAPLFKRCTELRIWVAGDEMDKLNNLLEVFENMETLYVLVTSEEAIFSGVDLTVCPKLQCVRFESADMREGSEDVHDLRFMLCDISLDRPVNTRALELNRTYITRVRPGLVRVELAPTPFDCPAFYTTISRFKEITIEGHTTADHVLAMGLFGREGPIRLDFRGGIDQRALEVLVLRRQECLKELFLRRDGWQRPVDPAVFSLKVNKSLLRLMPGPLQSAKLDLDLNKHLRVLDLYESFTQLEGGTVDALRQLGAQLATNTTLELLILDGNKITDVAVQALRLCDNKALKSLSLSRNKLSDTGLRNALEGNTTIRLVDASRNEVTERCGQELSSVERHVMVRDDDMAWEDMLEDEEYREELERQLQGA